MRNIKRGEASTKVGETGPMERIFCLGKDEVSPIKYFEGHKL